MQAGRQLYQIVQRVHGPEHPWHHGAHGLPNKGELSEGSLDADPLQQVLRHLPALGALSRRVEVHAALAQQQHVLAGVRL